MRTYWRRVVGVLAAGGLAAGLLAVVPGAAPTAMAACNPESQRAPTEPRDDVAGAGGMSVYSTDDGAGVDGGGAGFAEVNIPGSSDHTARGEVYGTLLDFRAGNNVTSPNGLCAGDAGECVHTGWTYLANLGVYQSSCHSLRYVRPPQAPEYRPYDSAGGPCWAIRGGFEGRTDTCIDGYFWWGEWRECWSPFPAAPTRQTFCWTGGAANSPPNPSIFVGPGGQPCARLERPGIDGSLEVCLTI